MAVAPLPNGRSRTPLFVGLVVATAIVAAATAAWLFPRSLPIVSLGQKLTRDVALSRADSFFHVRELAPARARTAVRFEGNDSLRTFVELAGGGADSLNALVRGRDVAPFFWSVRAFVPRDPREARVEFAPDGRVIGFSRTLAEADVRPAIAADSGERLAAFVLGTWIDERADRWKLITSSYETRKTSARVDRTYTFERMDRRIAGAGIRAEVVIRGDLPARVRQYVDVPESFRRRYSEMRSANELLALMAGLGALVIVLAGVVFLSRESKARAVRWREAMVVGGVIGVLTIAAGLNEMSGSWYGYDTAMSPAAFQARIAIAGLMAGVFTGLLAALTLAAAEAATRKAFPQQLDWWKLWTYRGTREVAARVGGGYAVAMIGFAYVAVFYLITRNLLGWWVPGEVLDDPNLIATPIPWMSGIAVSLNAGVWEETLFRALPLSLLSLWVGQRPHRRWWMAAGVIATALTFGFAHANYPSWPPYSRGVEIFFDACFWAVLVLTFGVLVTVIAHFVYDLVLFGLFATSGHALEYRISAGIIVLALLAPALAVVWRWIRQRGLTAAPEDARFAAWLPVAEMEDVSEQVVVRTRAIGSRSRKLAVASAVAAAVVALGTPARPTLGPQFTATRDRVVRTADSLLRASGGNPAGWHRLTTVARDTLDSWPRFLREHKIESQAQRYAATYVPPTWWTVRYVHTGGTAAQRTEEWRIRVLPNGAALDTRHLIPDSAQRTAAPPEEVRHLALAALARTGVNTASLQETEFRERALPARRDVTVTYTDTAVKLPAGAVARAWVSVAGTEPLVARRGVDLPESFIRADRDRQTNKSLVAGLCALLVLGCLLVGALIVTRKRTIMTDDFRLTRRQTSLFIASLIILTILGNLNSLPSSLFSYDTTEPWTRFTSTRALSLISAIPLSLFVYAIFLETNALRQRVGIPLMPRDDAGIAVKDMLAAGLGLAGLVFTASRLGDFATPHSMPPIPSTSLNDVVPALSGIISVPIATLMGVAAVAIPLLVIGGLTRRWSYRVLLVAGVLVPAVIAIRAVMPRTDTSALTIGVGVVVIVVTVGALVAWGSVSALSWLVAALAMQALGALHSATFAATSQARIEAALVFIVASVLIALVARYAPRGVPSHHNSAHHQITKA